MFEFSIHGALAAAQCIGHIASVFVWVAEYRQILARNVSAPQITSRSVIWLYQGKWVHLAKVAFEKYFMRKTKQGQHYGNGWL